MKNGSYTKAINKTGQESGVAQERNKNIALDTTKAGQKVCKNFTLRIPIF